MSLINFDEEVVNGVLTDKLDMENAVKVIAWIGKKRKAGRKGFPYEVDGLPVLSKEDAVSLKATFVHYEWCKKDAKLSSLAYANNKDLFKFDAFTELLIKAGMEDNIEEETEADV